MQIHQVATLLDQWAPQAYAEDWDNTGLLVGDASAQCSGILIAHDSLERVVHEAVDRGCNLVVAFHPIVFKGIKKFTGKGHVERAVIAAIKNDVAIYAIHTALDKNLPGVNTAMCKALGLTDIEVLIQEPKSLLKLTTYVPNNNPDTVDTVAAALYQAGAGHIGKYADCSFREDAGYLVTSLSRKRDAASSMSAENNDVKRDTGTGTFTPQAESNPAVGSIGSPEDVTETKLSVLVPMHKKSAVQRALESSHPYETVAHEWVLTENKWQDKGMGAVGNLTKPMSTEAFLQLAKETFQAGALRYAPSLDSGPDTISRVAVLGGSGVFAAGAARAAGAQVLVTGDLKYHDFFGADENLVLCDVGHYESERHTCELIHAYLVDKISTFAILLSHTNTNPVNYLN